MLRIVPAIFFALLATSLIAADDPATPPAPAASKPPEIPKGAWVNISDALVKAITAKSDQPMLWPGNTAGIAVDRVTGDIFLAITANGIWKSSDKGATYVRIDKGTVTGRCETGFALDIDPQGRGLMCFMTAGSSAMLIDGGKENLKSAASNMDFGAVDWTDALTLIAVRHETKGWAWHSEDGGASWKDFGPGYDGVGVFDDKTFVAVKSKTPGIALTENAGEKWGHVSDLLPTGRAMRVFKNAGYWTSKQGLLVSADKGKTWKVQGAAVEMSTGPYFGKDEKNIVVAGKDGLLKTTDGGATWTLAAPYPDKMKFEPRGWFGNFGWDPVNDIFYASVMGQPAYRWDSEKNGKTDPPANP